MTTAQAIWDWLPARRDRRRTTVPPVIAAELGIPVATVAATLLDMERGGHAVHDHRGSWHRGIPLTRGQETPGSTEEGLWD
ncbi:hypothetical protein [Brooklawnia cerclae]|uniref:Uncharacterized protein n=1 Tax=Brooklawnia cerclae TaxID=349934 RepID=A0ABX0SKM9_9ACTN|nr:hypothetical protein [Brooklawnia cerclae]NIH58499.1 hypothetical protein [Brooklawnia cerclae]